MVEIPAISPRARYSVRYTALDLQADPDFCLGHEEVEALVETWRRCAPWCDLKITLGLTAIGYETDRHPAGLYVPQRKTILVDVSAVSLLRTLHHEIAHAADHAAEWGFSGAQLSAGGACPHPVRSEAFARSYAALAYYLDEGGQLKQPTGADPGPGGPVMLKKFIEIYDGTVARQVAKLNGR